MTIKKKPKTLKLGELQTAYVAATTPRKKPKQRPDNTLLLFLPRDQVRIKYTDAGAVAVILVRDTHKKGFGKFRPFHGASTAVDILHDGSHVGISAPVAAWVGVNLELVNHTVLSDHQWADKAGGTTKARVALGSRWSRPPKMQASLASQTSPVGA